MKNPCIALLLLVCLQLTNAQDLPVLDSVSIATPQNLKYNYKQLIVPAILMTYGVIGIESDGLKALNLGIREEVKENIDEKISVDDFSQYAAFVSVYALNASGVKGRHNLADRSIILGTSYLMVGASVYGLKKLTKVERPDGSAANSFPSGHTATAFAGAEFLLQEYKDVSIWYGISGYIVATGTGVFRMYNNKHWLTDVAMGAGIGILSTKAAYWLFPVINNHLFKAKTNKTAAMVAPFYNGSEMGVSAIVRL